MVSAVEFQFSLVRQNLERTVFSRVQPVAALPRDHHHQSLFIHEIVSFLHGLPRNRVYNKTKIL